MSPDGKYISYLAPYERCLNVFVRPICRTARRVTSVTARDIAAYFWKGDRILHVKDFGGDENFHVPGMTLSASDRISDDRIRQATEFILSRQNADGGFGTYERRRASSWLEAVNPSEMFGQCMTERSYIECTGSSLAALAHVREACPTILRPHIDEATDAQRRF